MADLELIVSFFIHVIVLTAAMVVVLYFVDRIIDHLEGRL